MKTTIPAILSIVLILLTACWDRPSPEDDGQAAFDGTFPPTMSWDFQQTVALDLEVAPELLPDSGQAAVEVRNPNGSLIFRGNLGAATGNRLLLTTILPRAAESVTIAVDTGEGLVSRAVAIESGTAQVRFQ